MPQDYKPYTTVPSYDLAEDYANPEGGVCAKLFVVDRAMVYSAVASAVMDKKEAREIYINTFDTDPHSPRIGPEPWQIAFAKIFDDRGRTTWFDLPSMLVNGQHIEIGIVDIVTYPFLFGMTRSIADTPQRIWEINHNILRPFVARLTRWAGVWTIVHWNEDPLDDAPCHNLITFSSMLDPQLRQTEAVRLFSKLPGSAVIPVTVKQRIMDSRFCMLKRRPNDASARPMEILEAAEVVPQMLGGKMGV